jgi:hypothetical protein
VYQKGDTLAFESYTAGPVIEIVYSVKEEQEQVQPGEVHSSQWDAVDSRAYLSKVETLKGLRSVDIRKDPEAAVPYFTNGLGLDQFYKQFVTKGLLLPNKVRPHGEAPKEEAVLVNA